MDLFVWANEILINIDKSSTSFNNLEEAIITFYRSLFHYIMKELDQVMKYLGFYLKPNKYCI